MTDHENVLDPGDEDLVARSGITGLDGALHQTLNHLGEMFGISPGFSFYEERGVPNAKATNFNLLGNSPDGTVLFGLKLLRNLLASPRLGAAAVISVCAHEFAHIYSHSNGMFEQLQPANASPFATEQFADFIAGYYAGQRRLRDREFPAVTFAAAADQYGGGTHGTADERTRAVLRGYAAGYQQQLRPTLAARHALAFARGVF